MSKADRTAMLLDDLAVGQEFSFQVQVTETDVDGFAALSGDLNPLHMDAAFARARGFDGRVVHGAYLMALASRMLGMHLPGVNCLLQTVRMSFVAPSYVGDSLRVSGVVDQVSVAAKAAVVRINITNAVTNKMLATGKASVGFTEVLSREE